MTNNTVEFKTAQAAVVDQRKHALLDQAARFEQFFGLRDRLDVAYITDSLRVAAGEPPMRDTRTTTQRPTRAAADVLAERRRQVESEGYSTDHDDAHPNGEIAAYAAFYAMPPAAREWPAEETGYGVTWGEAIVPENWGPTKTGDRRRELVKAGALILAEIERLDRAAANGEAA